MTGVRDAVPFTLSLTPFAFACGLLGIQAGLSLAEIAVMSLLVYAGTAQFIGLSLIQAGAGAAFIVLTSFIVNLRYFLQGLSLAPFLSWLPTRWLLAAGFGLVDESYALTMTHYIKQGRPRGDPLYLLGCTTLVYTIWVGGNVIGGALGATVGDPRRWGLDFALPATFISLVMPQLIEARMWTVFLVAGAAAVAGRQFLTGNTYLILAAVVGTLAGVIIEAAAPARGETGGASGRRGS